MIEVSSSSTASERKEEVTSDELRLLVLVLCGAWLKERVKVLRRVESERRRRVGSRSDGCFERC